MSFTTRSPVAPPWCNGKHRAAHPERRGFESRLSGSLGSLGSFGSFGSTWRGRGCGHRGLCASPTFFFFVCCTFLCGISSAFFERCSHLLAVELAAGAAALPARAAAVRWPLLPLGLESPSVLSWFPPSRRRLRLQVGCGGSAIAPPTCLLCSPPLSQLPPAASYLPPASSNSSLAAPPTSCASSALLPPCLCSQHLGILRGVCLRTAVLCVTRAALSAPCSVAAPAHA